MQTNDRPVVYSTSTEATTLRRTGREGMLKVAAASGQSASPSTEADEKGSE